MDVRMENLPILQDFVPYRGRCPKREKSNVVTDGPTKWVIELRACD